VSVSRSAFELRLVEVENDATNSRALRDAARAALEEIAKLWALERRLFADVRPMRLRLERVSIIRSGASDQMPHMDALDDHQIYFLYLNDCDSTAVVTIRAHHQKAVVDPRKHFRAPGLSVWPKELVSFKAVALDAMWMTANAIHAGRRARPGETRLVLFAPGEIVGRKRVKPELFDAACFDFSFAYQAGEYDVFYKRVMDHKEGQAAKHFHAGMQRRFKRMQEQEDARQQQLKRQKAVAARRNK
jgi:hypothetical protein